MNNEYYILQNIKNIPIADYLHARGIQPVKKYGSYALYNAPYREDHNASMKVDFARNLWFDFGLGKGGSIIDLVMLLQGCNAHEAISHLAGNNLSFHSATPPKEKVAALSPSARHILGISEELPPHLQRYLQEERKIDLSLAKPYLRSVCYEVGGRTYIAIGFANRAGGYELRDDKTFKGTIAPKDISVIAGDANNVPHCIFEGFMDFLSYLTMKGKEIAPCIVLNSVSNVHRAVTYIREHHIDCVRAFLDNDEAGRRAMQVLQSAGMSAEDMSRHYGGYKDLNEYHVSRQKAMEQKQKKPLSVVKRGFRR
ncbi:toprim domain-containing protein [Hoylesella timonensis]|uniref:Mobilization protein n=1 Tax=Hoylesella timonensis S9-PR14 TaxID=1401062 RepID=A0A098YQ87_9BACT|nr:toprim domain-containing protein [Hoylesella timonensis]KGI21489.1 mobilization protein [Hoylesella timonensis S9-PR14]